MDNDWATVLFVLIAVRFAANPGRWQMFPGYLVAGALAVVVLAGVETEGLARHAGLIVALSLLALSTALAAGFPVRALPAPGGAHRVGVVSHTLERPVDDRNTRRLLVNVWYPTGGLQAEATRETLWSELHEDVEVPRLVRLLTSYLRDVKSHAHEAAPISKVGAPYPILVYNHALISIASENTLLMERLASEGFIVVRVRHRDQLAEHAEIQSRLSDDERARDRVLQAALSRSIGRDERARLSAELNTERYGALGLSLGGAVATRLCASDTRCTAVVNLDGGLFRFADRIGAPYLMLYSEQNAGSNDQLLDVLGSSYEEHVLADAKHLDLHDAAVATPGLRFIGALGPASNRVNAQKNQAVTAFFARELRCAR